VKIVHPRGPIGNQGTAGGKQQSVDRTPEEVAMGSTWRIDGYTIGSSALGGPPMHNGELHPDADELLYLLSGRIRVRLELEGGDREAEVRPGQALAIPRGTWHRIIVDEPGQLINVTPGPGGQHRPLREA
jgi:mannose-6-phosphate isomerase-like protein (cupin superfamily)